MNKMEKAAQISPEHKEALAILGSSKEFSSLLKLFAIEENNIVIGTFKINSSDVDLARKKAWQEGRLYELRKIIKTFNECKKE